MHCLLCHEKIPRLRAWTGKSEFCCDEHADLYKKQTMDRLLVDDSDSKSSAPALPIFDGGAPSVDHVLLKGQPNKAKKSQNADESGEVDALWKLAERMGGREEDAFSEAPLPEAVETQSADDALAALQALAAEAAQSKQDSAPDDDLFDELSSMESTPQLDSLPVDLAAETIPGELDEAPELELDALEQDEPQAQAAVGPELVSPPAALDSVDVPDLLMEGLAEAQEESLEPPELAAEFDSAQTESLDPPELAADFDAAEPESLEPPDSGLEELLVAPEASDETSSELSNPPDPADFDLAASSEAELTKAPAVRRAPKAAPKLRPATELQEMSPSPNLPEGGYALKPWTDALAIAGPDRSSLLSPTKFLELRKSSLNGTASAKFDPVRFRASERIAAVAVPISEPKGRAVSYENQNEALTPAAAFAWPAPLHAALIAAEMRLNGTSEGVAVGDSSFSVKQPALSAEFLGSVAFESRILEPRCSAILSPPERDVFASAAADEEESGDEYASAASRSDRDETDGGERVHVADLF